MSGNEKKFWFLFILLNCILFLPAYLLNTNSSTFLPIHSFTQSPWYLNIKSIFKRDNYDLFRLSIDLTILVAGYYFVRKYTKVKLYSSIASGYYLLLLIFLFYYHSMFKIYLVEPVLFNDIYLLKLGYYNLGPHALLIVLAIILFIAVIYFMFRKLFAHLFNLLNQLSFGKTSRVILWVFGLLLLFNVIKSGSTLNARHVFQLAGAKIVDNLQRSSETAKNISILNVEELNKLSAPYKQYKLAYKPDVYLLFVESYGKIVYQDSVFRKIYSEFIILCQNELIRNGWNITSNFSISPVSGGGSWLSYSSAMFGFRFPNQGTYLYFLRNTNTQRYTNMLRFLQGNGYKSSWINPLPENINFKIPWKLYTDFYSVDNWINYNDLDYKGKMYGFGPSPPDQFSLFRAEQIIRSDTKTPKILFYITHNSHNPFFSPVSLVNDWRELNNGKSEENNPSLFIKKPKTIDYIESIKYELQTLTRFIVETNHKNAVFLIIGDHQPPIISNEKNGFETPIHIIAADSVFIKGFSKYGFSNGLFVKDSSQEIRHEAIYSMFLREILRNYGTDTTYLPEYLPRGFNVK